MHEYVGCGCCANELNFNSAQRAEHLRWLVDNEENFLNRFNMKKNKTVKHKRKLTPNAVLNEVGGAVKKKSIKQIDKIIQSKIELHNFFCDDERDKLTAEDVIGYFQYKLKKYTM